MTNKHDDDDDTDDAQHHEERCVQCTPTPLVNQELKWQQTINL